MSPTAWRRTAAITPPSRGHHRQRTGDRVVFVALRGSTPSLTRRVTEGGCAGPRVGSADRNFASRPTLASRRSMFAHDRFSHAPQAWASHAASARPSRGCWGRPSQRSATSGSTRAPSHQCPGLVPTANSVASLFQRLAGFLRRLVRLEGAPMARGALFRLSAPEPGCRAHLEPLYPAL